MFQALSQRQCLFLYVCRYVQCKYILYVHESPYSDQHKASYISVEVSFELILCAPSQLYCCRVAVRLLQGLRCVLSPFVPLGTFHRYASQPGLNCSCKLLTKQPCPGFCIRGKNQLFDPPPPPLHFTVHFLHAGANYTPAERPLFKSFPR